MRAQSIAAALMLLLKEEFPDTEIVSTEEASLEPVRFELNRIDECIDAAPSSFFEPKERSYMLESKRQTGVKKYRNPILRRQWRVIKQP